MAVLTNPKHEAFAQLVAKGSAAGEAYRKVYKAKDSVAETNGPRLLGNAQVETRVQELQSKAAEKVGWDLEKAMKFALDVLAAKPEDASKDNPLCEVQMSKAGPYYAFPSKEGMFDKLCKLSGLYAPQKLEGNLTVGVSPEVSAAIGELFGE
jgi:hypothetical protein